MLFAASTSPGLPGCPQRRTGAWAGFVSLVLGFALSAGGLQAEDQGTVYFYSNETAIDNFGSLKAEFDGYLAPRGPFIFQPFSSREVFDQFIPGKTNCLVIVTSWHFRLLQERVRLEPRLVALLRQKSTQRRILCAGPGIDSLEALRGERIASAGTPEYARNMLEQVLHSQHGEVLESASILTVPKDIDALMAVSFRLARASVTTEESLAKLEQINPKQRAQLKVLATSDEITLPIVASPADAEIVNRLSEVIMAMPERTEGQRLLRMLGFDRFRRVSPEEAAALRTDKAKGGRP